MSLRPIKRPPRLALALALALAANSACHQPTGAGGAHGLLTQQQSAAPRPANAQASPTPRPNLCRGQKSPLPAPSGFVSDFAEVIDAAAEARLEARIAELKKSSGVELAVATVETTAGRDIFDYSLDVACGWGVGPGEGEPGGGVLLLVAVKDRAWRVQVSRSLEAALPDAAVQEIGGRMVGHFRRGDFGAGITAALGEHAARLARGAKEN